MQATAQAESLIQAPPIATLEGSASQKAKALAQLFGSEGAKGKQFFGSLVSAFARQSMPASPQALFARIDKLVYRVMGRSMARHFSQETKELFTALSQEDPALGGLDELMRSHMSLDLLFMMSVLSNKLQFSMAAPATCSCLAAWGSASANGKLYVGETFHTALSSKNRLTWFRLYRRG